MNPIGMGVATAMYLSGKSGSQASPEEAVEGMLILIAVIVIAWAGIRIVKRLTRRK